MSTQGPAPHPSFPRNSYLNASSKLPDRTASGALNPNPPPFGSASLARRDQGSQQPQGQSQPQQQGGRQGGQEGQREREPQFNPLNEISEEQREEVNEAFSLFDLDRDRHLDYHELRVALRALGFTLPKPDLVSLLQAHGVPRTSVHPPPPSSSSSRQPQPQQQDLHPSTLLISHASFSRVAAQKILDRDPLEEIGRAFELFDAEGKGYIDVEDLRRVARELGETGLEEEELRAMVEEFDLEGRGGVGRREFEGICLG
ncbi:MAG: hypothetical protein Q9227_002580 [Pyrenula ochraceoflavens]